MASSAMNHTQSGGCVLWTPWGPQTATDTKPRLSSLHRTLRHLASTPARKGVRESAAGAPECAFEPK